MTNCRYPLQLGPRALNSERHSGRSASAAHLPGPTSGQGLLEASRCLPTERETVSHSPSLCNLRAPQTIAISVTTSVANFSRNRFREAPTTCCAVPFAQKCSIPFQGPSGLGGSTSTRSTRHPGQAALSAAQSRDLMRTQPCIRSRIASTRLGFRVMLEACLRHDGWIFDSA